MEERSRALENAENLAEQSGNTIAILAIEWIKGFVHFDRGEIEQGHNQFKKWLDLGMDIPRTAQNFLAGTTPFQSFLDQFSFSTGEQEKDKED